MDIRRIWPVFAIVVGLGGSPQTSIGRTVLATVVDARSRPLVDLDADDFAIREAGQPQEILSAHIADYPVVVLIDDSAAAARDLTTIRATVSRFVTRIGDRPTVVGTIGPHPTLLTG